MLKTFTTLKNNNIPLSVVAKNILATKMSDDLTPFMPDDEFHSMCQELCRSGEISSEG
jgi:hypothetical protein